MMMMIMMIMMMMMMMTMMMMKVMMIYTPDPLLSGWVWDYAGGGRGARGGRG